MKPGDEAVTEEEKTLKPNPMLLAVLPALAFVQPFRPVVVTGNSMNPTFAPGQVIVAKTVDKPLERGDVVLVRVNDTVMLKRVALIGGDRYLTSTHYGYRIFPPNERVLAVMVRKGVSLSEVRVPAGHVFVVGDNLNASTDSRNFGPVAVEDVMGRVLAPSKPEVVNLFPGAKLGVASGSVAMR
jgi:signal peptidase I